LSTRRGGSVSKEAYYVILGLRKDFKREILGVYNFPSETKSGMGTICDDLKKRGIKRVLLWVTDGVAGVGEEVQKRFSYTKIQLCIIHKIRNILEKVRKEDKAIILADFKQTFNPSSAIRDTSWLFYWVLGKRSAPHLLG
ncbi:Transposase, mutator type, partial [Candidatus Omnitrophus magneticus]